MHSLLALLSCLALHLAPITAEQAASAVPADAERQILWQRSLEDALALSAAERRPLLIVLNMDGESASERIVRERYRDPAFVVLTQRFVCLVASAFRHSPRDYDEHGRRVPCPRLGEVTCGEHIALEPILFERFLGGERIAPRHALILPSGEKVFDLFLLFDLRELDRKLAEMQDTAPASALASPIQGLAAELDAAGWLRLAAAVDNRSRNAFEERLASASGADLDSALRALSAPESAPSIGSLRLLWGRSGATSDATLAQRALDLARARKLEAPAAGALRDILTGAGPFPGVSGLGGDVELLGPFASVTSFAPDLTLLRSYAVCGDAAERERATSACGLSPTDVAAVLARAGGGLDPAAFLSTLNDTPDAARSTPAPEVLPEAEALESELAALEEPLSRTPDDPALLEKLGRASLSLARRRMEVGASGIDFLLSDAQRGLTAASAARPGDAELWNLRARTAYQQSQFEEQIRCARQALSVLPPLPEGTEAALLGERTADPTVRNAAMDALGVSRERHEAQRWLGDGCARLLGSRSGGDPAVELEGIALGARAFALAAVSPWAEETDWVSLSSFFAALGRRRDEIAVVQAGLVRRPESAPLRDVLHNSLWGLGRADLAAAKAQWLADRNPDSAASQWYAGYARMQHADWLRRAEEADRSIEAYRLAAAAFEKSRAMQPEFADSAGHYIALAALGRGFAHLLAERRAEAAESLAEAIRVRPAIVEVRDSLDREAVDLLDGALEWRAQGPSPVDPLALLAELEQADPGNPAWAQRVADTELREGLRADGRADTDAGDRYLERSIAAARRGLAVADTPETRRALAQSATVAAERFLDRSRPERARELLREAAPLLGEVAPAEDAPVAELVELAVRLRTALGEARPVFRPGR